jgi:two-component system, OmpR family, sensor histidine kinase KdpD
MTIHGVTCTDNGYLPQRQAVIFSQRASSESSLGRVEATEGAARRDEPETKDGTYQELLAMAAHELRLPLSHIKGFVSSLRRTDVTWDEETRAEFLAEIDTEADRLARLVDSLLSERAPNGTEARRSRLAFTSPSAVVEGGVHRIRGSLGKRPVRIDLATSLPAFWMDASQMERVVANLVQNAIKYAPRDTPIGISARITDDGGLEISVEDEGPGIPPEDRESIFEPFFRSQATEQSTVAGHGLGLGLAICRSIVLAHGGRMEVTDRPGGGARFSLFLPPRYKQDGAGLLAHA